MAYQVQFCPHCGAALAANAQFCTTCGYRLDAVRADFQQHLALPAEAMPTPKRDWLSAGMLVAAGILLAYTLVCGGYLLLWQGQLAVVDRYAQVYVDTLTAPKNTKLTTRQAVLAEYLTKQANGQYRYDYQKRVRQGSHPEVVAEAGHATVSAKMVKQIRYQGQPTQVTVTKRRVIGYRKVIPAIFMPLRWLVGQRIVTITTGKYDDRPLPVTQIDGKWRITKAGDTVDQITLPAPSQEVKP